MLETFESNQNYQQNVKKQQFFFLHFGKDIHVLCWRDIYWRRHANQLASDLKTSLSNKHQHSPDCAASLTSKVA